MAQNTKYANIFESVCLDFYDGLPNRGKPNVGAQVLILGLDQRRRIFSLCRDPRGKVGHAQ